MKQQNKQKRINQLFTKLHLKGADANGDRKDGAWADLLVYLAPRSLVRFDDLAKHFKKVQPSRLHQLMNRLVELEVVVTDDDQLYGIGLSDATISAMIVNGWSGIKKELKWDASSQLTASQPERVLVDADRESDQLGLVSIDEDDVDQRAIDNPSVVIDDQMAIVEEQPRNSIDVNNSTSRNTRKLAKADYLDQYFEILPHFESDLVWDLIYDDVTEYPLVYDIKPKGDWVDDFLIENVNRKTAHQIFDALYAQYLQK